MENTIAIIAVGYNRVSSISRLLNSLEAAKYEEDNIPLIISIDKSDTAVVEDFADAFQWTHGRKIVDKHEINLGLRNHMMSLRKWFDYYDALIVLEDDIVVSPLFYSYVQQCYDKYSSYDDIAGFSLYNFNVNYQTAEIFTPLKNEYDVYFMNCAMSWGEVWMKKQWMDFYQWYIEHQEFTYADNIPQAICKWPKSSWLKYHTRYCIETNKYFVYPYVSFSTNNSDAGIHNNGVCPYLFQTILQMGESMKLRFPDSDKQAIVYDGFFENKGLYEYLSLKEEECCIDLNAQKNNREQKRFWLTTKKCDYKIIKSYALTFRPIEMNIFMNTIGEEIFLYDTTIEEVNLSQKQYSELLYRHCIANIVIFVRKYGFQKVLRDFLKMLKLKLVG